MPTGDTSEWLPSLSPNKVRYILEVWRQANVLHGLVKMPIDHPINDVDYDAYDHWLYHNKDNKTNKNNNWSDIILSICSITIVVRRQKFDGLVQENVTPLLTHWSYVFLAQNHRNVFIDSIDCSLHGLCTVLFTFVKSNAMMITSNGSWCIGIKGEMSGTVCVTFTWDIYIYMSCL